MLCPNCKRPNQDGLLNCDYCGTTLTPDSSARKRKTEVEAPLAEAGAKRKTEVEQSGAAPGGGKRKTVVEQDDSGAGSSGSAEPFDPFRSAPRVTGGGFQPAARGSPAAVHKARTAYDTGSNQESGDRRPDDVFAPASGARAPQATVGRRIIGWLITFDGNPDGSSFTLREGRNALGRAMENDIAVPQDAMVSSTHAFIIWRSGRARVADNNSNNGTFLNDEDVLGQVELHDGDVIRLGHTRFIVRLLDQEQVSTLWQPAAKP